MFYKWFYCYLCCSIWICANAKPQRNFRGIPPTCDSPVYCQGDLLKTVQMAQIFEDSKTFVDMSMRRSPEETLKSFDAFIKNTDKKPNATEIKNFVDHNFISSNELSKWIPEDFTPKPLFLSRITNPKVAQFARKIVSTWKDLGRKVKREVFQNPELHSVIPLPNGFIIPGGRFREYYYWDNYWIVEGLLICEMTETVRGIVDNFITMVKKYGFVPNGGRIYYTQRSQPPMLTYMAKKYFEASGNLTWLKNNIVYLDREMQFWRRERMKKVKIGNRVYDIGFYFCSSKGPRPESYREDIMTAESFNIDTNTQRIFDDLKAAAQSGWDFSSRWIFDLNGGIKANLSFIETTRVSPVDLNSYLYGAFHNLAKFYAILGNTKRQQFWNSKANELLTAFQNVFWHDRDGIWYDFDVKMKRSRRFFAASNLTPLWVNAYHRKENQITKVIHYLQAEGVTDYPGGIPATKVHTGEQWDFPNCFPPIQSLIVQGLENSGDRNAQVLARKIAKRWVETNMASYESHGAMFEKYDAEIVGQHGSGGEYQVQAGFGWTNGVVLDFINRYYTLGKLNTVVDFEVTA